MSAAGCTCIVTMYSWSLFWETIKALWWDFDCARQVKVPPGGVCSVCVSVFSGYRSGSSGWHESCCVQPPAVYILLRMGHHPGRCKHTVQYNQKEGAVAPSVYDSFLSHKMFYSVKVNGIISKVNKYLPRQWVSFLVELPHKIWIHATLHVFIF